MKNQSEETNELTILSLEDSQNDVEFIKELLTGEGFEFTLQYVDNQTDFIAALNSQKFNIILSDFSLPGFNAFGALKLVLEICPETPFIVVSGSIGEETAIELIKMGAVDYVLKDRMERLPYSVKRALEEVNEKKARKKIEIKLSYEQYLMQKLMDNHPDYIYFKDTESKFIRVNKSYAQSLGLNDASEAIGKTDFDFFDLEYAQKTHIDEQQIIKTERPLIDIEEKPLRLIPSDTWTLTTKMPLHDWDGKIIGTFGIYKDITVRKQMEIELKKRVDDLEYFHKFTVGREITMIELKKEINTLLKELGRDQKYLLID